jgi:glycogen synthase
MKLLIYSHFFAPSIGGVETIALSLADGLAGLRKPDGTPEFAVTVVTQTAAGEFDDRALAFSVVRRPSLIHLYRLIRGSDVVHVAGPALPPLLLGKLARKPVVIEHHGFQTICPTGQLLIEPANTPCSGHFMAGRHVECLRCRSDRNWPASYKLWLLTFVRRFLCAHVAANVMPTEWLRVLLKLPRAIAIPHGLEAITPSGLPPGQSSNPVIVLQGRLVTTKGARVFLEAASILCSENRTFELLVIGDGPERAALEEYAQQCHLSSRVRFAGRLAQADLESVLANAGVVVVPSLGGEVFGLVVAENMLRGLPIVASDLGSFVEVLGNTGLTFRTGDGNDLARQLVRLLDDSTLALTLGHRARQRVFDFYSRGRMIDTHARLYREICAAANT